MSKYLMKVRDMLCDELDAIAEKGEITAGGLDVVDKLTHSIKSIDTILAMQGAGYSERGYSYNYPRYYYRDGMHDGGYSEARRRDSMGRYSRADEHEHMVMELREAMAAAKDSGVREDIKHLIDKVERM